MNEANLLPLFKKEKQHLLCFIKKTNSVHSTIFWHRPDIELRSDVYFW